MDSIKKYNKAQNLPFTLYGQKMRNCQGEAAGRVELLLRPSEKDGLNVYDFLQQAENGGERIKVFQHLVSSILQNTGRNRTDNYSLNVSPEDVLHHEFLSELEKLRRVFHPSQIIIEIIEEKVPENREKDFLVKLRKVREQGFQISIDDFGVKYSDIDRVNSFIENNLLDEVKLDLHVFKLLHSAYLGDLEDYMIDFCGKSLALHQIQREIDTFKAKGIRFVVEGIENEAEALFAKDVLSADLMQGYLYHKPQAI